MKIAKWESLPTTRESEIDFDCEVRDSLDVVTLHNICMKNPCTTFRLKTTKYRLLCKFYSLFGKPENLEVTLS